MNPAPEHLILFTRYPEPGAAKTRLIPTLGPEGAAAFHKRLTAAAAAAAVAAVAAAARRPMRLEVRHAGGRPEQMRDWLGALFAYRPQGEGGLGVRMQRALAEAFAAGAGSTVLMGSDIPGLGAPALVEAFEALTHRDLVLGPAADGGYYLIGMTAAAFRQGATLFGREVAWGGADVLARTIALAGRARLAHGLLKPLADVDRPGDLEAALKTLCSGGPRPPLSVVIPALNEADHLARTLGGLAGRPGVEVVVVDGGSRDGTAEIARRAGARTLVSRPPRAIQMNAGAALASGDVLLFLHADTRLPEGFEAQVRSVLSAAGTVAGAFRLRIDGSGGGLRVIERAANWRSRLLRMPYGDQALFMERDLFWRMGGFPPQAIMEDFEMARRLRRRGRIGLADGGAATSDRRWRRMGALKAWLVNQWIVAAYLAGVSPHRLAAWYRGADDAKVPPRSGR